MRILRTIGVLAVAVVVGFTLYGFASAADEDPLDRETPQAGVTNVEVRNAAYTPRVIEVPAGTEVTWAFRDGYDHDVRSASFGSTRKRSGTFSQRFDAAGVYDYRCSLHANMTGRVIVTAN